MPTLTVTKNYDDGTVLTESQLDDIKTSLETFFNTTKIDNDNIQTGGVGAASIASSAVTAIKLATDAVETAKIKDANVTAAKLATDSVTTVKIAAANVTHAKLADRTVTTNGTDPGAGGISMSSSIAFSTTSTSFIDVTGASCTLTTTGRPVQVTLISTGTSLGSDNGIIRSSRSSGDNTSSQFLFVRDVTAIGGYVLDCQGATATTKTTTVPASSAIFIDDIASGTYTYKLQVASSLSSITTSVNNARLVVYEL